MPAYDFLVKATGEVIEVHMKMAEKDAYVAAHPELEPIIGSPAIGDPFALGIRKIDPRMKETLTKIKHLNRGSDIKV